MRSLLGGRPKACLDAVKECAQRKVKSVIVFASGFAEIGGKGVKMEEELRDLAQRAGMILCGPNCQGVVNLHEGATLEFYPCLGAEKFEGGKDRLRDPERGDGGLPLQQCHAAGYRV